MQLPGMFCYSVAFRKRARYLRMYIYIMYIADGLQLYRVPGIPEYAI